MLDKNTKLGRGVRTALQGLLGLLTFVYGILLIPGVSEALQANNVVTAGSFAIWIGLISYTQNFLEEKLK